MSVSTLLVIVFMFCECNSEKSSNESPHFLVKDGNIIFRAADDRNIEFRIRQSSGVSLNDINLLGALDRANNLTKLLDNYRKDFSTYTGRIESVTQRVAGISLQGGNSSDSTYVVDQFISVIRLTYRRAARKLGNLKRLLVEDDCVDYPCTNGGTCEDMFKKYVCHCADGWQGTDCRHDVDECSRFEGTDLGCQNGASCVNTPGSYECVCQSGYFGVHCTMRTADCSTGGKQLCGHGVCIQQNTQTGYKCLCDQGWTTDGTKPACIVDVDECNSNHSSCSKDPSVACINVPGSFHCGACPAGYSGNGFYCTDIDECISNNGGCSVNPKVMCINTQGSRMCGACPPGYNGDGVTCVFKGVCQDNNGGCHHLAQCTNYPRMSSTYVECICPAGYIGNGFGPNGCVHSLNPIKPCTPNPCVNGYCSINNVTGEYVCSCMKTYVGRNCDILRDPCNPSPCMNGGSCHNTVGTSFQCICKHGFKGRVCQTERLGCGGQLSGPYGTLKYPSGDYETYRHSLSCAWTITTNVSKILNITFTKFDIQNSTNCKSDWLQIHDGPNSASLPLGKFCGTDLPLGGKISTTHNIIYLWFGSNSENAKTGFELTWNASEPVCGGIFNVTSHGSIGSPGSPGNYPLNRDCYWWLHAPFGKRLLFSFFSLDIGNNTNCDQDYIEFSLFLNARDSAVFGKICNSSIPTPILSPIPDAIVYFHSDSKNSYPGFQLTYTVVEGTPGCGGVYTSGRGTIESLQSESSGNSLCEYKIQLGQKVYTQITFQRFDLLETTGCTEEYFEIRAGPNTDSPLARRYCGKTLPAPYLSQDAITIISSTSENSKGWKIQYGKLCLNKFFNTTGSFRSPNLPNVIAVCNYHIVQPPGYVIELSIKLTGNALHPGGICQSGGVQVYDGDSKDAPLIAKFCKSSSETITSTGNHLWIRHWPFSFAGRVDFEATYTSTDIGCGGILRNEKGDIASPVQPEKYLAPKCSWVIIAPPKYVVKLTWETFDLKRMTQNCTGHYVEIFDNSTDLGTGASIGKFCGSKVPPSLLSTSNIVTVVFVADALYKYNFLATYNVIHESSVCGGNYFTPAGILKSPGYPKNYSRIQDCTWTITVPHGQQILLNVNDFDLEDSKFCDFDTLMIRNGGTSASPLIGNYCGTVIPKQIFSHTNQLYLRFTSDFSHTSRGFKITWSSTATGCGGTLTSPTGSFISPQYPEPYGAFADCTWHIIVTKGSSIKITFKDIDLPFSDICNRDASDYIEFFDGVTTYSKSLGVFCMYENKSVMSFGHQVLVKFRSASIYQGRGFYLQYSTFCNNTLRGFRGTIESPNFLSDSYDSGDCLWNIVVSKGNKINITFSHFAFEKSDSDQYLEIKYLVTFANGTEEFLELGTYRDTDNPTQLTVNSHYARVLLVKGCGGHLMRRSGTIQSPNYPNVYPSSTECQWHIEVEFGSRVQFQVNDVDFEQDVCHFDWLKIYDGPGNSSTMISEICHQINTSVVLSTGNQMFIEFHSDTDWHGRGFSGNYSTIPTRCGGKFTAEVGAISSPNYPNNFGFNESCYWLIQIDEGHRIELNFEHLELPADCENYYIKVFDGANDDDNSILNTICNSSTLNGTISSSSNEMYIKFITTDTQNTTKGFLAKYRKACGSRITSEGSGNIRTTSIEMFNRSTCAWTIVSTDPTRHVVLTITQLQMLKYSCSASASQGIKVKIFGGETTSSPLLLSYCGTKVPPPIVSDGSAITIELRGQLNFQAKYSVLDSHCGGTFNSLGGYFATPGYPKYPSDIQCEWTINVAPGMAMNLYFHDFDIPESETCNGDFLEIRSHNASGPLLGVYCGKNKQLNRTHGGTLWMMFQGSKLRTGDTVEAKGFYGEYELDHRSELNGPHGLIASPLYPDKFKGTASYSWTITVDLKKLIRLTFKELDMDTHLDVQRGYSLLAIIIIYDGEDETAPVLKHIYGIDLPDPITSSTNVMYITFYFYSWSIHAKFLMEWQEISNTLQVSTSATPTVQGCGSSEVIDISLKDGPYNLTSPGYPNGNHNELDCEWIFSTISNNHLMVTITEMDTKVSGWDGCQHSNSISFYEKPNSDWELVKEICETTNEELNFTNLLKVRYISYPYLSQIGFMAKVAQRCGGSMSGPVGYVYFDKTLAQDSNCEWKVTVLSGRTIRVTFEELNIPKDPTRSCYSYLTLRNGIFPDSPLLGSYCGTDIPKPLNTTGNYLYVGYRGSSTTKGFKLKYEEVSSKCGGEIVLSALENYTEINSPNYPHMPHPHSECSWMIRAPPGETLRIDFEDQFHLTPAIDCKIEYVEVRDGGTELSLPIGKYCNSTPATQFSTDNMMFVKFFSNADIPKNGFKAKISMTYCGGTVRGRRGQITNPSRPTKDQKRNCTWRIVGLQNHYLTIQMVELKLQNGSKISISEKNNVFDVLNIGEYTGSDLSEVSSVNTSSNEAIINYIGTSEDRFILAFNSSYIVCGDSQNTESGYIMSPGYPLTQYAFRFCVWIVSVPEGRRITLNFVDLDLNNQVVLIFDGILSDKLLLARIEDGDSRRSFETSSNKMVVTFFSFQPSHHRGFSARYTSDKLTICSTDFSSDSGLLTQPLVRNSSYWCHWTHNNKNAFLNQTFALTINVATNSTDQNNSLSCRSATWYLQMKGLPMDLTLCVLPVKNYIFRSPYPVTEIYVLARPRTQLNFTISYNTYRCGGVINEQQGFLSSPNYPNKPSDSVECAWLLQVDDEQVINVTVVSMNLGTDCNKSFLTVYDGEGIWHPRMGKYCKSDKLNSTLSRSNRVWIEFKRENGSTGTGFKLQYQAISEGCGGVYHDRKRLVQSPNYSKNYPDNAECLWEIRSNPGYYIELRFTGRFHIEETVNCVNDYLEVWDWKDGKWISIARICGRNATTGLRSTGDRLRMLFRSDSNGVTASGFKVEWVWLCGGTFKASKTQQTIVSPRYPLPVNENLNCSYKIINAGLLNIHFEDFVLEYGYTGCTYNNLTISWGNDLEHTGSSTVYCSTNKPTYLTTKGNVDITLHTDSSVTMKGFKFTYTDISCGGNVNETTIIEGPDIHAQLYMAYLLKINCIWKIKAPPKQVAVLRLLFMKSPPSCYEESVDVFNGLSDALENRLASLCGDVTENILIHADSGNMLVRLQSTGNGYEGFRALVYFSHGPLEGCGGAINLTETKYIFAPDFANLDCIWRITAPRDYQIQIHITELNLPGECTKNSTFCTFVEIRDGGGPLSELIQNLNSTWNSKPEYREFSTSWNLGYIRLVLNARQNNAFRATLKPIPSICGPSVLNATKEMKTLTSPNYPGKYPAGVKCIWFISTERESDKIELHFVDFNVVTSNVSSTCDDDRLEISEDTHRQIVREGFGPEAVLLHPPYSKIHYMHQETDLGKNSFCGTDDVPFDYYSQQNSLVLTFRSQLSLEQGRGFKLEYGRIGCNRNYTSLQGRFFGPFNNCTIRISVPENYTISLFFNSLSIFESDKCEDARFEVRDGGPNGSLLFRQCGYDIPDPVFSYTNKLYIRVHNIQNDSVYSTYDVGYTSTKDGRGCGGELYNLKGWVSSPFYPNEFRNDTLCEWVVRVPAGMFAVLKFEKFDIQSNCDTASVTVTSYSDGQPTDHKFCKDDNPAVIWSDSKIDIVYVSSVHNGGTGWMASFKALRDDTLEVQ